MFKAKVVRIFCVVCPCLFALLLNCSALNSGKEQERQIRRRCMVNCFHSGVETFRRTLADKIWNNQSCWKQCLRNFGKDNFVRKHQGKDGSRRSKRETSVVQTNSTDSRRHEQENCTPKHGTCYKRLFQTVYAIPKDHIHITFHPHSGTRSVSAKISWIPLSENLDEYMAENLDEYMVIYSTGSHSSDRQYCCRNVSKTSTFTIVDNSSNGLLHGGGRFFGAAVLPLPLEGSNETVENEMPVTLITWPTDKPSVTVRTASPSLDYMSSEVVIIPVTIVVSMFVLLALLAYWYCNHRRVPPYHADVSEMEFDAFIIYSTPDEEWVKRTLLPILEEKNALKCCVHYRDFTIGKSFRENMAESVYKSRKTIAVVSHSFFKSKYCNHEMEIALGRLVERGDNSVIVIKLDDVDRRRLPKALKERSYIDYFKSNDKETWAKQLIQSCQVSVKQKSNLTSFV